MPHTLSTGTFVDLQDRFIEQVKKNRKADPLAPLTVLVPGQLVRASLSRELVRSGCPHANIRFTTVNEIARRIAEPLMRRDGYQIVADVTRDLLLKKTVDSVKDKLVYFARIADFRGFRTKLHSTISDLRNACATVPMLREAADDDMGEFKRATTQKIREIALLWETYDALLTEHHITDRSGVLELAIDELLDNGCDSHSLIAYGLDELSELERRFLLKLWQHREVSVYLPWCDTPAYEFTRGLREWMLSVGFDDQTQLRERAESGTMLSVAQRGLFQEITPERRTFDEDDAGISILSSPDSFRESEEITREALFPPVAIDAQETSAILMRGAQPYTNHLRNSFRHSSLDAYFHECRTLGDSHTGKALRKFIRLLNADYARLDVADFLLCGALRVSDELREQYAELPVAEWNHFSLLAGVTAGDANWRESLARLKDQLLRESSRSDPEDEDRKVDYASRLQFLDAFINWLNSLFASISRVRTCKSFSDAITAIHEAFCERIESDGIVDEIFQQLDQAAQLDSAMLETDIAGLTSCIESALRTPDKREGRYQETEPTVATIEQARGVVFDHVYLMGLNESEFPRFTPQDPLLLDYERELLSTALSLGTYSITIPRLSNRVEYEGYLFATALHSARRRVVLSYSRTGSQGRETLPSRFLLNTIAPLISTSADVGEMNRFIEDHRFSRRITLRDLPEAQKAMHRREYDASTIQLALRSGNASLLAHLKQSNIFMRGLDSERNRFHEHEFTHYDGALSAAHARAWSAKALTVLSASQLETYWTCPFRWFAGRVLNLDKIEDAARLSELDAAIRGQWIHKILEEFYRAVKLEGRADKLTLGDWPELESFAYKKLNEFEKKQPTGLHMIWMREKRRIMESLEHFFRYDIENRAGYYPKRFEWKFGDADHEVKFYIDDTLSIRLGGAIDRIDEHENGSLRILDYKSGKNYNGLRTDKLLSQRALQLHLYSFAAEQILKQPVELAEYYFMREPDNGSVKLTRENARNDAGTLRGILKVIVSGMQSGICPPYPDENECKHCRVRAACGSGKQTWKWRQTADSVRGFHSIREGGGMIEHYIPKDSAAREQIVTNLDASLLVEAAAGTGKTTLLIQRILNLILKKQVSLTKVVAITFTEKAAGELKQRMRLSLEAKIHEAPDSEAASLFRSALAELDLMPVTTIHGFCRDLIRQLPVEAGTDPDAQILDDANEAALKDEFWDSWLTEQLSKECEALQPLFDLDLPLNSSMSGLSLRDLFDELARNEDTMSALHVPAQPLQEILIRVQDIPSRMLIGTGLLEQCSSMDDKLAQKIVELREWTESIAIGDTTQLLRVLSGLKSFKTSRLGNKSNWQSGQLDFAREWTTEIVSFMESARDDLFSHFASRMIEWLKDAACEFHVWKLQRGLIGFQDLLVLARDLLHNSHPARAFFKERYEYLLVDEFQDTDPLQTEIVFYLAEKRGEYADEWQKVKVEPGKLFIVGDPKQSIYRFRRADLELYKRVKEKLEREGQFIKINVSFRSVRPIIEEVNSIFQPQMLGEVEGHYEPEYVAMEPVREAMPNQPAIELLPPPLDERLANNSSTQTARAEAAAIAEYIRALVDGKQMIEEEGSQRLVCWGDIAVLLRTWTNTYLLEREFRARDIPFELTTDRFFGERAEIIALRTILCALDNSFDEVNVVGALRSSFLGCSDDELFLHRINGGCFNYLKRPLPSGHLGECFHLLGDLHALKQHHTVSELMDEILSRTHGAELLALKPFGAERVDALRKLISFVRSLEQDGTRSLHQIIRQLGEEDFMKSAGGGDGGEMAVNCVRVMTFFKAKGLEFPVVCLYDLGHGQNRNSNIIYDRDQSKLEFSMKQTLCTSGFQESKELEQARQDYEEMRLLYVAMTRARDRLVIPLYWLSKKKQKPNSFQKYLEAQYKFGEAGQPILPNDRSRSVDVSGYDLQKLPKEQLVMDPNAPFSEQEEQQSIDSLNTWERRRSEAAARLKRSDRYGRASAPASSKYPPVLFNKQSDGAVFGSFVHDILERIDLPGGADLKSVISDLRRQQRVTEANAQQAEALICGMLTTQLFTERIAKSAQRFRELPFAVMLEDVLYEGKMDLVFMEQGQAVIVDYKTNRGAPTELVEKYSFQAAIYARALEQIVGKETKEVILYHLRSNTPVHLSRADLEME